MFFERRVYQGSSGRVYPLPLTDRIAESAVERKWRAVWIENDYLRALVLPELGGRIHRLQDKTNGYDLVYYQPVIKPALVGLAGPWISGGIEFNWPQHHRPATFLPVDWAIEEHADGSKTIWCSDHDPMVRMKGMHGVCLHPGKAYLELKVRVYNRTLLPQTFLWWANVAIRVHEAYQSFFPPDVTSVADHARRSTSAYPLAGGVYYGVNYGERAVHGVPDEEVPSRYVPPHCRTGEATRGGAVPFYAANDLSFYANIPTPCSYMCVGSAHDFFGGYDYTAQAGLIHVANHHISPGKKQWTWGNHEFGYAWDRNLTDPDARGERAPYIELMAGVYTDNQPDFSFLQPGETKSWGQFWYPIRQIGPAQQANIEAAISLTLEERRFRLGVAVTSVFPSAVIRLERATGAAEWQRDLAPDQPFVLESPQAQRPWRVGETTVRVLTRDGREIISYKPQERPLGQVVAAAQEPPPPAEIASTDQLYLTGLHLEQYRHATCCPTLFWREALRRDPGDARCNNALGLWHLRRGEWEQAVVHFRKAIQRLTSLNANPYDGEVFYNLGLCWRFLNRPVEAYAALYKATWNQAWAGAAFHALAEIDCQRQDWSAALDHLQRALAVNSENLRARNLVVLVLRKLGRADDADQVLQQTRRLDPLDWWARHLAGERVECDLQTRLDIAHDYARAGFWAEAIELLRLPMPPRRDLPDQSWGAMPMIEYTLGCFEWKRGGREAALAHFKRAAALEPDYCFPARLEEIEVLQVAMDANPTDSLAAYYIGNLLYDRRRHQEAIMHWEASVQIRPQFSLVWRNLGLAYFNVSRRPALARRAYERAFRFDPTDARLLFERDQLWKRLRVSPAKRLRELEQHPALVQKRDDLSVELCALYNLTGQPVKALTILGSRKFQPWEGGEGAALGQHVRTHLTLGRQAFRQATRFDLPDDKTALLRRAESHFRAALTAPINLGEAKHLLANQAEVYYWLGCAMNALGEEEAARNMWSTAARSEGDFQEMTVRRFIENTYYSGLAMQRLGQKVKASRLFRALLAYARQLGSAKAWIDYFATSLPALLLFDDDLTYRQHTTALFLQAQALLGLGRRAAARRVLRTARATRAADLMKEETINVARKRRVRPSSSFARAPGRSRPPG
jgi:tetratricopeptide (TPR) repeat protein